MLQGEPCQTGEDAARRVEQGGNKENTRRDGDRPAFLLHVLHTLFRRVAHQRTAGTETPGNAELSAASITLPFTWIFWAETALDNPINITNPHAIFFRKLLVFISRYF